MHAHLSYNIAVTPINTTGGTFHNLSSLYSRATTILGEKGKGSMPAMHELFLRLYSMLFTLFGMTFEVSVYQCCTDTIQSMEQMYAYVCSLVMSTHFRVINEWMHSVCTVPVMNATTCACVIIPEGE